MPITSDILSMGKVRNFVECTINKKSHDLLVKFKNRYS